MLAIFKRIKDWWNPDSLDAFLERAEKANADEPQEIWQWQINCVSVRYPRYESMPQNFGLLIGTCADAEARLKASVRLLSYETKVNHSYSSEIRTYEFTDPEQDDPMAFQMQRGAIRCVSENLKLLRTGLLDLPHTISEFIVECKPEGYSDFRFHPIKPQEQFIKGERHSGLED